MMFFMDLEDLLYAEDPEALVISKDPFYTLDIFVTCFAEKRRSNLNLSF